MRPDKLLEEIKKLNGDMVFLSSLAQTLIEEAPDFDTVYTLRYEARYQDTSLPDTDESANLL